MLSSFLFITWRKERERGQDRNSEQALVFSESDWYVILVVVKDLLRRIRSYDRMSPPEGMCRTNDRAIYSPNPRDVGFPPSGLESPRW